MCVAICVVRGSKNGWHYLGRNHNRNRNHICNGFLALILRLVGRNVLGFQVLENIFIKCKYPVID